MGMESFMFSINDVAFSLFLYIIMQYMWRCVMSGYAIGLAQNAVFSLCVMAVSIFSGCYSLYKGISDHRVLLMVFGGMGIGFGFLQWMLGFSLAIPGVCFGSVGAVLGWRGKKTNEQ